MEQQPTQVCRECRRDLPRFASFARGHNVCKVCEDPEMSHEALDLDLAPYARSNDLEAFLAQEDARLAEDHAATMRRVDALDGIRASAKAALDESTSPAWAAIIGGLVIATWDTARRLSGNAELQVGARPRAERSTFNSLGAALWFVLLSDEVMGVGQGIMANEVDEHDPFFKQVKRNEKRIAKERAIIMRGRAFGEEFISAKGTRTSSQSPKHEDTIGRRVDVQRAIRESGIGAADFAMLAATQVGVWQAKQPRDAKRIVEAFKAHLASRPLTERVAFSVENAFRWAATEGTGTPAQYEGRVLGVELVRRKPGELADALNEEIAARRERLGLPAGERVSAQAIGKRIGRAKEALAVAMQARGLIPMGEARAPREKPARAAVERVRPSFGGL